ncbi:MAG TPA: glycogen/starch/alpha-glucan phosphorylase [Desulfomonilaceae bacterium]|nr:glycogen/starch/alpha-glucan phosphorylase [Desulfomonilaceae bacterium]
MDKEGDNGKQSHDVWGSRRGLSLGALRRGFMDHLRYTQGRIPKVATLNDYYMALAFTVKDRLLHRWIRSGETYLKGDHRSVSYLSAEFLLGPQLANNLINLGIHEEVREAFESSGGDWNALLDHEPEPGLGNGGLGRLAACFLDSLATVQIPAIGYGIRYEFGIFRQSILDGGQIETTDKWLYLGNPWESHRPEIAYDVKLGGRTEHVRDQDGRLQVRWVPNRVVRGVAYDTPVLGYRVNTCNTLRLWKAEAAQSFDFQAFNVGDYYGAVDEKVYSENITKVLYPNDEPAQGKQLRLEQQYFFVSCSLQDMLRICSIGDVPPTKFHEIFSVQLNDTHPALAVPELMRLLIDEHGIEWGEAWDVTHKTFGYTNHTLLPEALEKWPLPLFRSLFPRHVEIIFEINHRFLEKVRAQYPGDESRAARMSLIDETGEKYIRMANLACVGSFAINGVAELHTELLEKHVLRDFFELFPEKFSNKTNGVTPRRFIVLSNPRLAELITRRIGDGWIKDLDQLRKLEVLAEDKDFKTEWSSIKRLNKTDLAGAIRNRTGIIVDPDSLFDIQVKRFHEYKRQHLNVLHILTLYSRIKQNRTMEIVPRTFIFGGKAAPGYFMAKLIIRLVNAVADVVNHDPDVRDRIKVVFFPNFNVKNSRLIYPAADLSEQISTAGKEASGTGNMKFSMNGALTIGTLDGANVEIREQVGPENFFLFGLTAEEVYDLKSGGFQARDLYESNNTLKGVIDLIGSGLFSSGDRELFKPLVDSLLYHDEYLLFADYQSYVDCQDCVSKTYSDQDAWTRMSILNAARMGKFSSDRAIRQYCDEIWKVSPVPVSLEDPDEGES